MMNISDKVCGRCGRRRGEHYVWDNGTKYLTCERRKDNPESPHFAWGGKYRVLSHRFFGEGFTDSNPNKAFKKKKGVY